MEKSFLAVIFLGFSLFGLITTAIAGSVEIANKSYQITLTAPNGTGETRIIFYRAYIDDKRWQTGSSSKPFNWHFFDDRRGNQEIRTWINRTFSVVTITGEVANDESLSAIYNVHTLSKGGWSSGEIIPGKWINKHKNLGEMQPEFDLNFRKAKAFLEEKFYEVINHDINEILPKEILNQYPNIKVSNRKEF